MVRVPAARLDPSPAHHQLEGMNKYQALRAGPAYRLYATPEQIAERFRPKKLPQKKVLLDEERLEGARIVHVRLEDLGDDRIRATVYVMHRWKKEAEALQWVPAQLQQRCAAIARELLLEHADVEKEWERSGAWCTEGVRRQLELLR